MSEPVILVEKKDAVALVTLNRPQAHNALSRALREAICETFDTLAEAPTGVRRGSQMTTSLIISFPQSALV